MQDLVDNFDDIDGPGNNSYLSYDAATGQFTIVPVGLQPRLRRPPHGWRR